jgi:hypothetical protein
MAMAAAAAAAVVVHKAASTAKHRAKIIQSEMRELTDLLCKIT